MGNGRIKRTQALDLDKPVMEKLKSWSFGKIRDLVLSIQDEMKCDSEYQIRREKLGKRGIQEAGNGQKVN